MVAVRAGINSEGIDYFFRFLECNGAHRLDMADWEALGTDVSAAYDKDNDWLRSITDVDVDIGMEWLVFGLVKKITAKAEVKLLDLFFGLERKGVACVGPATDFHSYTWQVRSRSTILQENISLI
jgi:hypothetical protein